MTMREAKQTHRAQLLLLLSPKSAIATHQPFIQPSINPLKRIPPILPYPYPHPLTLPYPNPSIPSFSFLHSPLSSNSYPATLSQTSSPQSFFDKGKRCATVVFYIS